MSAVKLKKPHTHAGRKYPAGATLKSLRPDQAEWLVGLGIAEEISEAEAAAPAAAKPAKKAKE